MILTRLKDMMMLLCRLEGVWWKFLPGLFSAVPSVEQPGGAWYKMPGWVLLQGFYSPFGYIGASLEAETWAITGR